MFKKIEIAIVDDDQSVREGLVSLMQSYGFDVMDFDSAASFLEFNRQKTVDCLIADVHMPEMTGLELFHALTETGKDIPTILITARFDPNVRARALQSGVCCYLSKPFGERDLLDCIQSALGAREAGGGGP